MINLESLRRLTRRDFLKVSGGTAAFAALPPAVFPKETSLPRFYHSFHHPEAIRFTEGKEPPPEWEILAPGTVVDLGLGVKLALPEPEKLVGILYSWINFYPPEVQEVVRKFAEAKGQGLLTCEAREKGTDERYQFPINIVFAKIREFEGQSLTEFNLETPDPSDIGSVWLGIDPTDISLAKIRAEWPNLDKSNEDLWHNYLAGRILSHEITHLVQAIRYSESCCPGPCNQELVSAREKEAETDWIESQAGLVLLGQGTGVTRVVRSDKMAAELPNQVKAEGWQKPIWLHPLWLTAVEVRRNDPDWVCNHYIEDQEFRKNIDRLNENGWLGLPIYPVIKMEEMEAELKKKSEPICTGGIALPLVSLTVAGLIYLRTRGQRK